MNRAVRACSRPSLAALLSALCLAGVLAFAALPASPAHAQGSTPVITIAADQDSVTEGETANFTLTRVGDTTNSLIVDLTVSDPGAFRRGDHWQPVPATQVTARFAAGSSTARLSLPTQDDRRDIPDNGLTVSIIPRVSYMAGDPASASVTITDNDVTDNDVAPEVELVLSETSVPEGDTLTLILQLHGGSENLAEVRLLHGFPGQMTTDYVGLDGNEPTVEFLTPTEENDLDEADRTYGATILPLFADPDVEAEYWTVRGPRTVTATATVTDDDLPLVYVEQVEDAYEEGGWGALRLVRLGQTAAGLDVMYRTSESGHDVFRSYAWLMGRERTRTIPASADHRDVLFNLQWDDGDEDEGEITLKILPSSDYRIDSDRSVASFRVIDDDPSPVVSVSGASASEAGGTVEFTVSLAAEFASRRTVTVDYATTGGTASATGGDYVTTGGTLTFPQGQTSATIAVPVNDDSFAERDETFTLTLSNPVNATLPDGVDSVSATGTIEDDEPVVGVSRRSEEVTEGEPAVFDLARDGDATREITVDLVVFYRGTRTTAEVRSATFPPDTRDIVWSVDTVDDAVDGPDTWIGLLVPKPADLPAAYHSASVRVVGVTILDNDLPTVTVEAAHSDRKEGQDVEFTLTRQGDLSVPLTVNVTITGGGDYLTEAPPQTVAFAEGSSTAPLSLPTEDDTPVDDDDTLTVTVAGGAGYQAGEPADASVSLFDSQRFYPSVSIRAERAVVNEGEDAVFTLTRSDYGLDESLTVRVRKSWTAWKNPYIRDETSGNDFDAEFEAGSRTATVVNPTTDETVNDGNSRVKFGILPGPYTYWPGPRIAETWIRDDDIPTVTITSATANRLEGNRPAPFVVVDGEKIYAEVIETGFEEIVENHDNSLGYVISRTGGTGSDLVVQTNGYGFYQVPGAHVVQWGSVLTGSERLISGISRYNSNLDIQEGEEASFLDPSNVTDDLHSFLWMNVDSGQSSTYLPRPPHTVTALGGIHYTVILPFYCETVPGDCGYQPQYLIGSPGSAAYRIHNNAQGVRVEADREEVTEGGSITFTLHRYGASPVSREAALTVRVQVTQDGEFMDGVPPQAVTFAGHPEESELTATVTVPTIDDLLDEANGAVTLTILPPAAEDIGENTSNYEPETRADGDSTWTYQATVRVLDDDEVGFDISDAAADEAAGSIEFTVSLPGPSALETSVDWATAPSGEYEAPSSTVPFDPFSVGLVPEPDDPVTVAVPGDYVPAGGTLTFDPGETSKTFTVTLLDDDLFEGDETFVIALSNPSGAGLTALETTGTINNDDQRQLIQFEQFPKIVSEGEDAGLVIWRYTYRSDYNDGMGADTDPNRERLEVDLAFEQIGDCQGTPPATAVFEAGDTEIRVPVPTVDDDQFEPTCRIKMAVLADYPAAIMGPGRGKHAYAEVVDNDMPISISDAVANEGDGVITFTVSLAEPAPTRPAYETFRFGVRVATVDGTATSHADFVPRSEWLGFRPGEQEKEFTVSLVDDAIYEGEETFTVTLSDPVHGRIKDAVGVGSIKDGDIPPKIVLSPPQPLLADENRTDPVVFRVDAVDLQGNPATAGRDIRVHWQITPETATPGEDYQDAGGVAVIPAGQISTSIEVYVLDDDLFEEIVEHLAVELTEVENAVLNTTNRDETYQKFSIYDTDVPEARITADGNTVTEGQDATFTVRLFKSIPAAPVELTYTVSGTGTEGEDYTAPGGTLTIPAGEQSAVITIATLTDNLVDPGETLVMELTGGRSVRSRRPFDTGGEAATVTILDEGTISAAVAGAQATEGAPLEFTVTLSIPTNVPVNVEWQTRSAVGEVNQHEVATPGLDYETASGIVTVPAQATSATFSVATIQDSLAEAGEQFRVELTGASRGADPATATPVSLGVFSAVGAILDDDVPPDTVTLKASPATVAEDAGAVELYVTATLNGSNSFAADTLVPVAVSGGNAVAGEDYTASSATLVIYAGQLTGSGTLNLTPLDDLVAERSETVQVSGASAGLAVTPAQVTITDNDAIPTSIALKVAPGTVDEGAGATDLAVTAEFTAGYALAVDTEVGLYMAGAPLEFEEDTPNSDGTITTNTRTTEAASSSDYTAGNVILTIRAGETQAAATLVLEPVDDDIAEGDETLEVRGLAGSRTVTAAAVTITDNDREPTRIELSVEPAQVNEDGGDVDLTVTATLTGGSARTEDTSVSLGVHGVTATEGDDYAPPPDVTLTIPAGSTTVTTTLSLTVVNDDLHEGGEQLIVRGSNAVPGLPVDGVRISIADDDPAPTGITLSLDTNRIPEDAGLRELVVTATLNGSSTRTVDTRVNLDTGNVSTSDADYSSFPDVLTIRAGQPQGAAAMLLVLSDDQIDEDDEILEVRGATAELALPVAAQQVIITDDDSAGVSIDPTELTVDEGGNSSYTVVLDTQPSAEVTVTISGHAGTDVSLSGPTLSASNVLTFTAANWETPQTVTVSAAQDEDAADQAVTLSHTVAGAQEYAVVNAASVTVTIAEDDMAGVSIDPTTLTVPEGGDSSYTVVLDTQPSADVTVTVSGHDGTDVTLSNTTLTFTTENWETPQTVTVDAAEDADALADQAVILSHAVAGTEEYQAVTAASVTVTIEEDDAARVSIDPTEMSVPEGGDNSYTVVLDTQPSAEVTVTISGHAGTDVSVTPSTLTFTSESWGTAQTVTVSAAQDEDAATDEAVTLSHTVSGTGEYQAVTAESVTVTIDEDDAAGVSVNPKTLTVPEGGDSSYTVVLDTQPTAEVTVTINGHDGTDVSVAPSTLTFTSDNWGTAQTVTVSAADDPDAATDPAVTLSHTIAGTGEYQNVTAGAVPVTIVEADTSTLSVSAAQAAEDAGQVVFEVTISAANGQAVTVAYATSDGTATEGQDYTETSDTLTFPANSIASQTISVPVTDDTVDEEDETFTLTLSQATVAVLAGGGTTLAVTGTITDNDDPQVQASFGQSSYSVAEGGTVQLTVTLSADPERTVTIPISRTDQGASAEDYTGVPESVSFGSGETSKSFTVTAAQDLIDDDGESVDLSFGTLPVGVTASSDNATATVTITDDDTADVTVSTTALTVAEGGSNSYTVVLDTEPTGDVTITISGYVGTDLTLSGLILSADDELIFTADDWDTPQTVTVAAAQDPDAAADLVVTLGHAVSGAEEYQSVTADDVVVTITEDDTPGVSIDPPAVTVVEGQSNTYTVVLDTRPSADVTVTISGHDGTDVSVAPSTLIFTSDNWNAAQTVTVRAAQDDDAAVDGTVTLAHAVSSVDDADYNSVTADSVAVTIDEEDTAGVSIAPTALTVLEGQSNSYKVVLNTQPTAAVVVTVGGHVGTELSLSGETLVSDALTFTGQNWATPQTVTLTAGSVSANTQVTLNHFVVGGDYGSLTVKGVNVTIVDSQEEQEIIQVGVTESEQSLAVLEGGSNVYEVVLSESPTGDVTVTVTVEDAANNDITTKEASLVFTSENWNLPQTVTVRAAHDDDALQDPVVQISHGVSGANFADRTIPGVAVTITEDDFPRVTVGPQFLEILEGSSGRYTVVLTTRPSGEVTITIGGHADTDITLSDTTLTFTSENWETPLEVTVSAAQDDDATADPAVTLKHTVEGGGYQGVVAWSVTVTITEDDTAGVSIDSTALTVPEGDNGAYTVKLNTQPSGEVIIDITGGGDVTVSPGQSRLNARLGEASERGIRAGHQSGASEIGE